MGTTTMQEAQKPGMKPGMKRDEEDREREPIAVFGSIEEAQKARPTSKAKLYRVDAGGKARFVWAFGHNDAVGRVARQDGYTVASTGSRRLTPEQLAAMIEQMDPSARKALLARVGK